MTTVLIPAHNEADVIARCLERLLGHASDNEFDVLVLSNGSTDNTIEVARQTVESLTMGACVKVLDIAEAGKAAAINRGLDEGAGPDFIVLDADVLVDTQTIRQLAGAVARPGVLAASTSVAFDFAGVSLLSRSYHRYWSQIPSVAGGLAGRGIYALSAAGVDRLGRLPLIMADDRFIDLSFGVSERQVGPGSSTVVPTRGMKELIARKARVFHGNSSLTGSLIDGFDPADRPAGSWLSVLRSHPLAVRDLPTYLGVNLAAKLKAKRLGSDAPIVAWERADS